MPEAVAKVEITQFRAPEKKCRRCGEPKAGLRFGVCGDCNKAPRAKAAPAKPAAKPAENSDLGAGTKSAKGTGETGRDADELSGGAVAAFVLAAVVIGGAVAYGVTWFLDRNGAAEDGPSLTVHQGGKGNG